MNKWLRNCLSFAAGIALSFIALEAVMRLLPVPMGLYRTEDYQRWPLINYEAHRTYTSSMSWDMQHVRRGSTNNYGHLAPFDYIPASRPVIVVGDSFINAEMNRYEDTLQSQLAALLGQAQTVYGLGANGLSISDYLALSALAATEFSPSAAVFLLIDGDVSESLMSQIGHYSFTVLDGKVELKYRPLFGETFGKKMRRLFGDSALYRYIQLNLHFDISRLFAQSPPTSTNRQAPYTARLQSPRVEEKAVVDHYLERLALTLRLPPSCIALLFHSDTYLLADPKVSLTLKDSPLLTDYFRQQAKARGYHVVDLKERFQADYVLYGKRLDFWPLDRHLNGRGHGIAAKAAFDALSSANAGTQCTARTKAAVGLSVGDTNR